MGSPLSPTLANVFICHYEKMWLNKCPSQVKPAVYRRYVDDTFVLFKSKEYLKRFVNYMNLKRKIIKFTFEIEDSNYFSFLNVQITCKNKLLLRFFAKPHLLEFLLITIALFLIPRR